MGCRVVLVDANVTQREGIRRLLEGDGFETIAETASGRDAVRLALHWHPDAVLMGLELADGDGITFARHVTAADPRQRVALIGAHVDDATVDAAIGAGALGVLTTDCTLGDVAAALRRVAEGDVVMAESLTARGRHTVRHGPPTTITGRAQRVAESITQREREVLQAIVDGMSCREAAARLYMSHKTLKNHLGSIYAKLGAHDRTQAVLTAVRLGVVQLS